MFESLQLFLGDPILSLAEDFKRDSNPDKVNLTVGVYCNEQGQVPVFDAVLQAEQQLAQIKSAKTYLPICGTPIYQKNLIDLILGESQDKNIACASTLGSSGALRVAGELLAQLNKEPTIWLSDPTWPNHINIFSSARLNQKKYRYQNRLGILNLQPMLDDLQEAKPGDVVLLHGCCHNPTSVDPSKEQWSKIFELLKSKQLIPFFDIAYHGLADNLDSDLWATRKAKTLFDQIFIAYSFSKIMGLYGERAGALLVCTQTEHEKTLVKSNLLRLIRSMYSTPPAHGSFIVSQILGSPELKLSWLKELASYQTRLSEIRKVFQDSLEAKSVTWTNINKEKGLFSMLPISKGQALALRSQSIYLLNNGRANIAGLNKSNVEKVAKAIASVLA